MTSLIRIETANDLIQRDYQEISAWLDAVWKHEITPPSDFSWDGLAEVLGQNADMANMSDDPAMSLKWTRLAVAVYSHLLSQPNVPFRESLLDSQMTLRANMIGKFGTKTGDPILDVTTIVDWFFQETTLPFEVAVKKATDWQKTQIIEDMRVLRRIKNRLGVISRLDEMGQLPDDKTLRKWLSIRPQLP